MPTGFFAGPMPAPRCAVPLPARAYGRRRDWEADDPYRFPPVLGELDVYLMAEGSHRRIFERLGAHPTAVDGVDGVAFAVWAPNARRVSVVGDFNQWDGRRHPMRKRIEAGVLGDLSSRRRRGVATSTSCSAPNGGLLPLKADPVGFAAGTAAGDRLARRGLPRHEWGDAAWMDGARQSAQATAPDLDLRGASRLVAPQGAAIGS